MVLQENQEAMVFQEFQESQEEMIFEVIQGKQEKMAVQEIREWMVETEGMVHKAPKVSNVIHILTILFQ